MSASKPALRALYDVLPLAAISDAKLADFHRQAGAHPADDGPDVRRVGAAFSLRRDVPLLDAMRTLRHRLRQLDTRSHETPGAYGALRVGALGLRARAARGVEGAARGETD